MTRNDTLSTTPPAACGAHIAAASTRAVRVPTLSAGLALLLGAGSVAAQTAAAPTAPAAAASAATTTAAADKPVPLKPVEVNGAREAAPYKADKVQSAKITQPLLDTPKSIAVVPGQVLREQNAQTLQDLLQNVSGITFTSGEGNLGWGDFFTIRGFSAEQSLTIDGVRDAGMASRSDTFNLEQAEVYKGTGSVESGVSAVGGSVNLVSKEAHRGSAYNASIGLGTDGYRRATVDLNRDIGETSALRINLMRHHNDVAGRDVTDYDRYGAALSFATGLGTSTRLYLDLFHQRDDNTPDGGLPIQRGTNGSVMPGISRHAWFGASNLYTQQSRNDTVTARIEHDLTPATTLRNQFRYERADTWSVLAPARFNVGTTKNTLGYVGVGPLITGPGGVLSYGDFNNVDTTGATASLRLASVNTSKRYTIADDQLDAKTKFALAGMSHELVTGVEVYRETYGDEARTLDVPTGTLTFPLAAPSTVFPGTPTLVGADGSTSVVTNAGVYATDTITLSPRWQLQAALRYDRWKAASGGASRTDGAWSGRTGLVYKLLPEASLYTAFSRAAQPSAVGVTTNNAVYGTAAQLAYAPALSRTWEGGAKWDALGGRLALTGAVFRTELSDSWEYNADDSSPIRALPAKRVQGFELGAQGDISRHWSVYAGVSNLHSRITKGANAGDEAKNVPDWTGNLWATYRVDPSLSFSYGLQYVGKRRYTDSVMVGGLNNTSSTATGPNGVHPIYVADNEKTPGYAVQSLAARWRVNRMVALNLNLANLSNRMYWSRVGASLDGFQLYGVPGAGRTLTASVDLSY